MYPDYFAPMEQGEENAAREIVSLIEKWSGCPFSHYKRPTLLRRIHRRMILTRLGTFQDYLKYLKTNPKEFQSLFDSLTIKVSRFFRDPEVFDTILHAVLPELFNRALQRGEPALRVWCSACATGEEAYSAAILIKEFMKKAPDARDIPVFVIGSDVDALALKEAQMGLYDAESLGPALDLYPDYFTCVPSQNKTLYAVNQEVKEIVHFVQFDSTSMDYASPPSGVFSEYDMIFLRNVLIYYDDEMKETILRKVHGSLKPKGYLVVGKAEAIPAPLASLFNTFSKEHRIYIKESE